MERWLLALIPVAAALVSGCGKGGDRSEPGAVAPLGTHVIGVTQKDGVWDVTERDAATDDSESVFQWRAPVGWTVSIVNPGAQKLVKDGDDNVDQLLQPCVPGGNSISCQKRGKVDHSRRFVYVVVLKKPGEPDGQVDPFIHYK